MSGESASGEKQDAEKRGECKLCRMEAARGSHKLKRDVVAI